MIDKFRSGKLAVNCKTQAESDSFLRFLHDNGFKWYSKKNLNENDIWHELKDETCYVNRSHGIYKGIEYGSVHNVYFKDMNIDIIKYSEWGDID